MVCRREGKKMGKRKWSKQLDRSSKLLALFYSILVATPIYGLLGNAYYVDYLTGFVFLGALLVVVIIALIFLIIFRRNNFRSLTITLIIVFVLLFWGYEVRLLDYESYTYHTDVYREPEELLEDSGIYILVVGLQDIHYIDDEEMVRDTLEKNGLQVFDTYKIKNRDRYRSKITELKQFWGFGKEEESFQVMGKNVRSYIDEDITFINEFLSRENLVGDSAGLALGLTAMVHQGNLANELPLGITGTLESNGDVMQVGGIKAKMMIAEQNGFPVVIIPLANREEAEVVKLQQELTIEILPVSHIDEAVLAIKELNAN